MALILKNIKKQEKSQLNWPINACFITFRKYKKNLFFALKYVRKPIFPKKKGQKTSRESLLLNQYC